jgi:hypothetical protein
MTPVTMIIGLSFALIIGGLLIAYLRTALPNPIMQQTLLWVGIVLVVIGLIFLVTPVLLYIYQQLHQALGA